MKYLRLCILSSVIGICLGAGGAVSSSGGGAGSVEETDDTRILYQGKPLELICAHNVTEVVTVWTKNGKELEDKIQLFKNSTLYIKSAMKDDVGEYSCKTPDMTEPKIINVIVLRLHKDMPKSTTVLENDKLALSCHVQGIPHPTVEWRRDGLLLEESINSTRLTLTVNEYNVSNANLLIKPVLKADAGNYVCLVSQHSIQFNTTTEVRVKDIYAALWPFLGIVAEVIILCVIIFIYEKRRINKNNSDESDSDQIQEGKCVDNSKEGDVRQRK